MDPVPLLPPLPIYYHPSPGYDITSATGAPVTVNDIKINPGIASSASGFVLTTNLASYGAAHTWYFGPVTTCFSDAANPANPISIPVVK